MAIRKRKEDLFAVALEKEWEELMLGDEEFSGKRLRRINEVLKIMIKYELE